MGYTFGSEPGASVIPMEILRDVAAQHGIAMSDLNEYVTVHEIGHQFNLGHETSGVMRVQNSDAEEGSVPTWPINFSEQDLKKFRKDIPTGNNDGP